MGNHPQLSISELYHRYPQAIFQFTSDEFALVEINQAIDQAEFDQLGGFIKVAKMEGGCHKPDLIKAVAELLATHHLGSKLDYGVSMYGLSEKELRPLLLGLKKVLRSDHLSSRFINHQFKNITAAQYKSIKQKGIELMVVKKGGSFLLGEVVGVQDIDAYSKRDFEKPFRDMKMGMMPPKMAQSLINIAQADIIWDPFCGSGTLVMEGVLMGKTMWGSDIQGDHVEGAYKNIIWLKREFGIQSEAKLFEHDATEPLNDMRLGIDNWALDIEAIAFEGDLGLPHNQNIHSDLLNKIIVQLTQLYVQFFSQLKKAQFKGVIACALPYFKLRTGKDIMMDRLIDQIENMGFKRVSLLPDSIEVNDPYVLKYSRDNQAVGRGIYRFKG